MLQTSWAKISALFSAALLLSGAAWLSACSSAPSAPDRPNIVLIMADDMGQGDPQIYNKASKVPTPNINRLAQEGIRFTDAHTPSSVCTPTRYGLLTGRYAWRTSLKSGVLWGYSPALIDTGRMTIASILNRQGYVTGAVGKWHLGLGSGDSTDYSHSLTPGPNDYGFDYFFGIPASLDMEPYVFVQNDRPVERPRSQAKRSEHRRKEGGGFWRAGPKGPSFRHIDVLPKITEKAVSFIDRQGEDTSEQPFFLYLPFSAPHTPWLPTEEFRGKSGAGYYGDFAAQVDASVGQVLKALERHGFSKNTMVIYTSDNGGHWPEGDIEKWGHDSNNGWRGQKADIWEGGHRVPFIVRWPGKVEPGSTSDETISLTDMLATTAAVVGAEFPAGAGEDSYNILPAILGHSLEEPIREATVHHSLDGMFAIRQGPWKLIVGRGSGGFTHPRRRDIESDDPQGQLYNLENDPGEKNNLYNQHPEIINRLKRLLERYKEQGYSRPMEMASRR